MFSQSESKVARSDMPWKSSAVFWHQIIQRYLQLHNNTVKHVNDSPGTTQLTGLLKWSKKRTSLSDESVPDASDLSTKQREIHLFCHNLSYESEISKLEGILTCFLLRSAHCERLLTGRNSSVRPVKQGDIQIIYFQHDLPSLILVSWSCYLCNGFFIFKFPNQPTNHFSHICNGISNKVSYK